MAQRTVPLTAEGKARLEEELENLRTRRRPELSARIQEETESGDVSDNAEYEDLKEQFAITEARIADLEQTLARATLVEKPAGGIIGLGSTVTLRGDDGIEETWMLVRHEEANTLEGRISTDSPVGRAVEGRRAGDSATVITPGGEMTMSILKVE
jgi:transcription elongation factor GreA